MNRIVLNVPFGNCEYYPCGLTAVEALLRFHGYCVPLVLHDEWVFQYVRPEDGDVRLSCRLVPFLERLRRCSIRIASHRDPDGEAAWGHARARIAQGHPVVALADTYHLEPHYFPSHRRHHSGHYIILAGYDDAAGTVHVVDPAWPVQFRGDIPLSAIKEVWGSEAIPQYTWLDCHCPEPRWRLTRRQAVAAIQRNLEAMRFQTSTADATVGLEGLRRLARDFASWKELKVDQARTRLKEIYYQLRYVVIERDRHGKYLGAAAGVVGDSQVMQVGDQLRGITQKWLVLRNLCLKGHLKATESVLERLHDRLLEIAALEEDALAVLESCRYISGGADSEEDLERCPCRAAPGPV